MCERRLREERPNRRFDEAHQARSSGIDRGARGSLDHGSLADTTVTIEASAGRIHAILESLIGERKRLQRGPREASLVEANRMAICYWQEQLDRCGRPDATSRRRPPQT